jgi:hypothetical protein
VHLRTGDSDAFVAALHVGARTNGILPDEIHGLMSSGISATAVWIGKITAHTTR